MTRAAAVNKNADKGVEWVPEDTFGARLALIRQRKGWNVAQAAEACELNDETWRQWEKTGRTPREVYAVARQISRHTGCDYNWLIAGGDLARSRWTALGELRGIPSRPSGPAKTGQRPLPLFLTAADN